jgi:hypothetical protein
MHLLKRCEVIRLADYTYVLIKQEHIFACYGGIIILVEWGVFDEERNE